MMNPLLLKKQLQEFLIEDIGSGDLSASLFEDHTEVTATIMAKENGIMAGGQILSIGYELIDSSIQTSTFVNEGEKFDAGTVLAEITGRRQSVLSGERVILNLLQRLSGIASITAKAVSCCEGETRICDTRKTTPGLRMFEKYAVRCGGGYNHRFGLYDTVMLKDNHLAGFPSIREAVETARKKCGHTVKIEVETETEEQVIEAVLAGADIIMFDNCSPEEIKQRLTHVPSSIITEASGGITLDEIKKYSETGVDYISLGYLTHSYKALDISMNIKGVVKHDFIKNVF